MLKDKGSANGYQIAFWCTVFNMLFEYSMRGINNLTKQPILFFILAGIYFTYFSALEDLIVRFKLKEHYLMATAFFFGTFYVAFATGEVFVNPNFMGINVGKLFFVNVVWWGLLQGILTFYFANRIVPRDWSHPRLRGWAWALCIAYNATALVIFQTANPHIPKGSPVGYATILAIIILSLAIAAISIKRHANRQAQAIPEFHKSFVLDFLAFASALLFLILAIFFTADPVQMGAQQINQLSTSIVLYWSLMAACIMLIYRVARRKPFPF